MSDEAQPGPDADDEDGVDLLADAVERFERGDVYTALSAARDGRARVHDPEAVAEADALLARLTLDRVPLLAAAGLLVLVLVIAAIAAS